MAKAVFNLSDIQENLVLFLLNIKINEREKNDIKVTLKFQASLNFIPMEIHFKEWKIIDYFYSGKF